MGASKFAPRRAKPGQEFGFTTAAGEQKTLKADEDGVVRPTSAEEEAVLLGFGLPIARKAVAEKDEKEG